jgi:2-dehydropantoate 2-reductase
MKITIMGSGNIGSLLGSLLTEAGQDVTLVDIRPDLIEAISKEGMTIDMSDGRTKHIKVKITSDAARAGISDLVIIATKGYSTRSAIEDALPLIGKDTYVLSVQNGAGNIETIADVLKDDSHVVGGVFHCIVTPLKLNKLSMVVGTGGLNIGPMNGKMGPHMEKIAAAFNGTDISVSVTDKVQDIIWSKLLLNTNMAAAASLHITNDQYLYYPSVRTLVTLLAQKCADVARAMAYICSHPEDPVGPPLNHHGEIPRLRTKPQMLHVSDIENNRKLRSIPYTASGEGR